MKQNGNKIRYMKYKDSLKLAAAVLAVALAFPMAAQAKAWDFENGSYVDASGAPVEGAVAKGITVTKYQNRANKENGIDWGKAVSYTHLDIPVDAERIGLKGSPTKVKKSFTPPQKQGGVVVKEDSPEASAQKLFELLNSAHIV